MRRRTLSSRSIPGSARTIAVLCAVEYGALLASVSTLVEGLYMLALVHAYLLLMLSAYISFSSVTREARSCGKRWFAFVFGYTPLAIALMLLISALVLIRGSAGLG